MTPPKSSVHNSADSPPIRSENCSEAVVRQACASSITIALSAIFRLPTPETERPLMSLKMLITRTARPARNSGSVKKAPGVPGLQGRSVLGGTRHTDGTPKGEMLHQKIR
jgi:hypothetical protein